VDTHGDDAVDEAKALVRADRCEEAIGLLEPWLDTHPRDARAWATLGAAYFELRDYHAAERAARRAVDLRPEGAVEWCNLGTVLRKAGQYEQAEEAQTRAIELDPNYQRAKVELRKTTDAQRSDPLRPDAERGPMRRRRRWLVAGSALGLGLLAVALAFVVRPRTPAPPSLEAADSAPVGQPTDESSSSGALLAEVETDSSADAPDDGLATADERRVLRSRTARRAVSIGKELYADGNYQAAIKAFEYADEVAPHLSSPEVWIEACREQIRIANGELEYREPEPREQASYTGGTAAESQAERVAEARERSEWAERELARSDEDVAAEFWGETHHFQRRFYRLVDDPTATPGQIGQAALDAMDEIDREYRQDMRELDR